MDMTVKKKKLKKNPQHLVSICVSFKILSPHCLRPITKVVCAWVCSLRGLVQKNVITEVYGALTMARPLAIKTTQLKQLVSAPYKHHLHSKDPILITNNITA